MTNASNLEVVVEPPTPDVRGFNGRPSPAITGDLAIEKFGIQVLGNQALRYLDGAWTPAGEELQVFVKLCAGQANSRAFRGEVEAHIRTYAPKFEPDRTGRYLVGLNCTADLDAGEFVPHSPEHRATHRINASFDADVDTAGVRSFIAEIAAPGYERRLIQLGAYALTAWRDPQAIGIVLGPPGSGKTTYAQVLTELLRQPHGTGFDLVSAVSPQTIGSSRFALAAMEHALLNIVPDTSRSDVKSIATLKALSGNDVTMIERKGQDPYPARLSVFLMFMANGIGAWPDAEGALLRRVKYAETRKPASTDPALSRRLTSPESLSGWARLFVQELWALRREGFAENDATLAGLAKFHRDTNIVPRFIDEMCETGPGKTVPRAALWLAFKSWAEDGRNGSGTGRQSFNAAVAAGGFGHRKSGVDLWDGLALKL